MGVFILLLLILTDTTALATGINDENGSIANIAKSARIPPPPPPAPPPSSSRTATFKPGIAIIVGVITTIFSITLLLLLYVKHCKRSAYISANPSGIPVSRKNSGINPKVIQSLPMFRFSSLRGQKDGLECAVCLNRFEAEEVLRLLPKCKHAFHVECVDTWLDGHSTCPLCRYRVHPEDVLLLDSGKALYNYNRGDQIAPRTSDHGKRKEFLSPRMFSGRHSSAGERASALEIIVENSRQDSRGRASLDSWNSRRKTGDSPSSNRSKSFGNWKSSRRKAVSENLGRRDGQLPVQGDKHILEHRIVISVGGEGDEEARRRWSDAQAAEILYLGSEMILGGEEGRDRGVINGRSVSEITGLSRNRSDNGGRERGGREEGAVQKRWLDWIPYSQQQQQKPAVDSAPSSSSSSSSIV